MAAEQALYSILSAYDYTGEDPNIYPGILPQYAALPALTFFRVSTDRRYHMGGQDKPVAVAFQVECYAQAFDDLRVLAKDVHDAANAAGGTYGNEEVEMVDVIDEGDVFDTDQSSGEDNWFRSTVDLLMWHKET